MARAWHLRLFWSVLGGVLATLALYLILTLAALLLPPDLLMQAVFAVPVFAVVSVSVGRWTVGRALRRDRIELPGWPLTLGLAAINISTVVLLAALLFHGIATVAEAILLSAVLFASGQGAIVWRLSNRDPSAG